MNRLTPLTLLAFLFLITPVLAQEITIGSDGIVRCKDVPIGTQTTISGKEVLVADYDLTRSAFINNRDVSNYCVSNILNTSGLFATSDENDFNQDISSWDVSNVIDMTYMFGNAYYFNQDIGNWDVSSVTSMEGIFYNATNFNQDLSSWDVSQVVNMKGMFAGSGFYQWNVTSFNADISKWNVSRVVDMSFMFGNNIAFNADISSWDVSFVQSMDLMFYNARVFNQDLTNWCVVDINTEPSQFAVNSSLPSAYFPQWGSCPGRPLPVQLISPGNGEAILFNDTVFSWKADSLATGYIIQIEDAMGNLIIDEVASISSFQTDYTIPSNENYFWRVSGFNENNLINGSPASGRWSEYRYFSTLSGVDTESFEVPETFVLKAAYPNPFNPVTTVTYGLPAAAEVRITATDLLGRQVATLVSGDMKAAGYHTVQFNADGLASGTYLIRMEAGDFVATQQVVLLK